MKYQWLILILIILTSCNDTKKNNSESHNNTSDQELTTAQETIKVKLPDESKWKTSGIEIDFYEENNYREDETVKIINKTKESGFIAINNVKIDYIGSLYRIKMMVKDLSGNAFFGLRIQEVYPNRLDAVFDLNKGELLKTTTTGDFTDEENANIKHLGNGWYECSLEAQIYSNYIRILFGVTDAKKGVKNWEASSKTNQKLLIVPSSLTFEVAD